MLRDGQIIESGSHRDLLTSNGAFAAMWAEQISADDESQDVKDIIAESSKRAESAIDHTEQINLPITDSPPPVVHQTIPVDEEILADPGKGKAVEAETTEVTAEPEIQTEPVNEATFADAISSDPEPVEAKAPSEKTPSVKETPPTQITFPGQIAFPGSTGPEDDSSMRRGTSFDGPSPTPGVTFEAGVNPSRSETPDPDFKEPKKKLMSSQNFQRLARRISIGNRKQSSGTTTPAGSPPPMQRESSIASIVFGRSSREATREGGGSRGEEGSVTASASASVKEDTKEEKKRSRKDSKAKISKK